jgi:hypothetical protein
MFQIINIHIAQQWEIFALLTSWLPPNTPTTPTLPINKNHDMVTASCALVYIMIITAKQTVQQNQDFPAYKPQI